MSARDEVTALAMKLLHDKLAQCTQSQRDRFPVVFPNGVKNLDQAYVAIDLINRTLADNEKRSPMNSESAAQHKEE